MKAVRQFIRSLIASVVFALVALMVLTGSSGQEVTTAGKSAASDADEQAKQRRAKLPFAKGVLQAHDLLRRTLTLKTEDGVRTFIYTDRTYIFRGKEKIVPDKLIIGETIAVRFDTDQDGRLLVRRIKAYEVPRPTGTASSSTTESAR